MPKIISIIVLILAIVLFPPAALAFVSQNAIPGDAIYPVKRKLEDVILSVASVNPTTKAWFSVTEADRRFQESAALLAQGKVADTTLNELVAQTNAASVSISQISNSSQQAEIAQSFKGDVGKYIQVLAIEEQKQQNLNQIQPTGVGYHDQVIPSETPTQINSPIPSNNPGGTLGPSSVPSPTLIPNRSAAPTSAPTQRPTSVPTSQPTATPTPPSQDPKEICSHLPSDKSSLTEALKQLCGINDQIQARAVTPAAASARSESNNNSRQNNNSGDESKNQNSSRNSGSKNH